MKKNIIIEILALLMVMMLLYASFSKYFDFAGFKRAMHNQPFQSWASDLLVVILPPIEILTAIILISEKTRKYGFIAAAIMMLCFTIYIVAILLGYYPRVPCSCGGIIRSLSWKQHLYFNLFFLLIAIWGSVSTSTIDKIKTQGKFP